MVSKEDISALVEVFQAYPEVRAAYLFGSAATGSSRGPESDIDLGLFIRGARYPKVDILTDLAHQGFDHVDLVRLDAAPPVVQFEAVRLNRLIYAAADFDRGGVYSRVVRRYLDLLPMLKRQRQYYKQRLIDDTA